MMKKTIAIVLFCLFLFNSGGYFIWFRILQCSIRKEIKTQIKQGLKEKDLTLIEVPVNSESGIRWIKPTKEFIYNGEMYDIVKSKINNNKKIYYCINDKKEKKLFTNLKKRNDLNNKSKKLLKSINNNYFFQANLIKYFNHISSHNFCSLIFLYKSKLKEVLTPPPQFSCQA